MSTSYRELTIESLGNSGHGVGRVDNFVLFVPFSAPGDQLKVRITQKKKTYGEAEIHQLVVPGPSRVKAPCPAFETCGGCQWQHIKYSEQLVQKQQNVLATLERIGGFKNLQVLPTIASPQNFNYRSRVQVKAQGGKVGFFKRKTQEIVDLPECLIVEENLNHELKIIREKEALKPSKKVQTIELPLKKESTGFTQVNKGTNSLLQKALKETISGKTILDLYCGNGNFTGPLAEKNCRVFGVDSNTDAIKEAQKYPAPHAQFVEGDCVKETQSLADQNQQFESILINPPRVGTSSKLWEPLSKLAPREIIIVSCNPSTLARDLKSLKNYLDFTIKLVQPFDMFPQTYHVEVLVHLTIDASSQDLQQ